ncbi:MAG: cytidine deaminase [Bacteroidales bacterium]|nr:cytidine deaminase [Bacteroidales bacterium]
MQITIDIEVVENIEQLSEIERKLVASAKAIALQAYAPYSKFYVGAAVLLKNGEIVSGNNQENAAYPSGLCAERTAIFYANAQYPEQSITTLAVAVFTNNEFTTQPVTPCGSCRQVMLEAENRYQQPMRVIMVGQEKIYIANSVKDLLPLSFDAIK